MLAFSLLPHLLLKRSVICPDGLCTMVSFSQDFFKDAQGTAVKRLRFLILALILIEVGQIGMLRAWRLLADGDGPLVEWLRFRILALLLIEVGQVVEPGGQVGMLGA